MKNIKKIVCLAIAVLMIASLAMVGASAAVAYEDAQDGDLLYEINFNGDLYFEPKDGTGKWNKTGAVASADGKSVTVGYTDEFTQTPDDGDGWGRAKYHGTLDGYSVVGNSYSLEFTVQSDVRVGILLDGGNGFVVNPKDKYTWIGSYGSWAKIASWESYADYGSETNTETYVIEIAFSDTMSKDNTGADCYAPTLYKLYVKGADGKITLIREVEPYATNMFDWEIENGTEYFELDFTIVRYHAELTDEDGNPTLSTVSDVKLYKGIGLYEVNVPVEEEEEPDEDLGGSANEDDNTNKPNKNTETHEPPTKVETKAPETEAETDAPKKALFGCLGSVSMTGVALVGTCAAVLAIKRGKKEEK